MQIRRQAMLEMFLCAILWSFSGVLTKMVSWNVFAVSSGRSFFAGIIVLLYMAKLKYKLVINKKTLLLGVCVVIIFLCYLPAIRLTSSANAIVLQYTAPIYVLVFSALFLKLKVTRLDIAAVIITVFGVGLCFFSKLDTGSLLGNALGLLSGVFLAVMFLLCGEYEEGERLSGLFIAQVLAFITGFPYLIQVESVLDVSALLVMLQGIVQLGLPYVLYSRAVRHCPALTCSLISVIEPLLNPIWVYIAIGENPGILSFAGSIIVLATVTFRCVWTEKQAIKLAAEESDGI